MNAVLSQTVVLDQPIKRGEQVIESLQLRKPNSGELRGLNLVDIAQMDVSALRTLLPRISIPTLTTADIDGMDPADLLACGAEVSDFLLQRARKPVFPAA
jgi:hypothetical protein